jgi:hypothetical protein
MACGGVFCTGTFQGKSWFFGSGKTMANGRSRTREYKHTAAGVVTVRCQQGCMDCEMKFPSEHEIPLQRTYNPSVVCVPPCSWSIGHMLRGNRIEPTNSTQ